MFGLLFSQSLCQVCRKDIQLQYLLYVFLCVNLSIMTLYVSILSIQIFVNGCFHLHTSTS